MTTPIFAQEEEPEPGRAVLLPPITQMLAATVLAGATGLVPLVGLPASGSYSAVPNDPFASATTYSSSSAYDASASATDIRLAVVPRWSRYVERRLKEIRSGAHDFTGLQVPSSQVVDLARQLAWNWFYPDTPTPSVLPSENGDVLYVWHKAGWDVEICVGREGIEIWAYHRGSGSELRGSMEELGYATSKLLMKLAQA